MSDERKIIDLDRLSRFKDDMDQEIAGLTPAISGNKLTIGSSPTPIAQDIVNVNDINGVPTTAYASADAARAAVDASSGLRIQGQIITYLLAGGWYTDQFIGSDVSGWTTASNWKVLGPVSVSQNTETGHTEIEIGSVKYPVASIEDVSKYIRYKVQSTSSAAWAFGDKLLGKKGYFRLLAPEGEIVIASFYDNATSLNESGASFFQYLDLSEYTRPQIYLSTTDTCDVYLDFLEEDVLSTDEILKLEADLAVELASDFATTHSGNYYTDTELSVVNYKINTNTAYAVLPEKSVNYKGSVNASTLFKYNGELYVYATDKLVKLSDIRMLKADIDSLAKKDIITFTEDVSSSSATWAFNGKLTGKKGYARLYTKDDTDVQTSLMYRNYQSTGIQLFNYWQPIDFSSIQDTIRIYLQTNQAGRVYIDFIDAESPHAEKIFNDDGRYVEAYETLSQAINRSFYLDSDKSHLVYKVDVGALLPVYPNRSDYYYGSANAATIVKANDKYYIYSGNKFTEINDIGKELGAIAVGETPWRRYGGMQIVTVKKDGSGDFTTIQDAINSINDASVIKQYEVQVYDDFIINDLTELWLTSSPTTKNTSTAPNQSIALVITKDWVHIRGCNGKKTLAVISPNLSMAGSCFQYIQTVVPRGNCIIDNFNITIKGGRYAIHQESGGSKTHPDYHATTIYRNLYVRHYGNSEYTNGASWTSSMAQANGTTSGLQMIYENCEWVSDDCNTPYYTHSSEGLDQPNRLVFKNCKASAPKNGKDIGETLLYFADRYSGQTNTIELYNCDFPNFYGRSEGAGSITDNAGHVPTTRLKGYCLNNFVGFGNKLMRVMEEYARVFIINAKDDNYKIDVVGGTAKEDIVGVIPLSQYFGIGIKGSYWGSTLIADGQYSRVASLPYILGNCASNNKTLIVRLTNLSDSTYQDYTITFDQNYMTADGSAYQYNTTPAISQDAIISAINAQFSDYFSVGITGGCYDTVDDCKEEGINSGDSAIQTRAFVVRDIASGASCWRLAAANEKADGIAATPAGIDGRFTVLLADKNLFHMYVCKLFASLTVGTMYRVNAYNNLEVTTTPSEASFIAVGSTTLMKYK